MRTIGLALFLVASTWALPASAKPRPLLLWRVERDGAVSHLLGTCHLFVPLEHALPAPHDAALDGARVFYDEADVANIDPIAAMRASYSEQRLAERLGPEDWPVLSRSVRGQLPASNLDRLRPWAVWSLIATQLPVGEASAEPPAEPVAILDVAVVARARSAGVEVRHLETLDQQLGMLGQFDDVFLEALRPNAASAAVAAAQADALGDACSTGEVDALRAMVDDPANEAWTSAIFTVRNDAWMTVLEPELARGGVFVSVGGGHLVGGDGLLSRLAAQGYTSEQLTGPRSRFRVEVGRPQTAEQLEAPPVDAERLAAHLQSAAPVVAMTCADGSFVRTCMHPDQVACEGRVSADLSVCYEQWADRLPAPNEPLDDAVQEQITTCRSMGLAVDAMVSDSRSDDPMCAEMWRIMGF